MIFRSSLALTVYDPNLLGAQSKNKNAKQKQKIM